MMPCTAIAVAFLSLIALLQLGRFLSGWKVTVHGSVISVRVSGISFHLGYSRGHVMQVKIGAILICSVPP